MTLTISSTSLGCKRMGALGSRHVFEKPSATSPLFGSAARPS